jgi:hypothetical protein
MIMLLKNNARRKLFTLSTFIILQFGVAQNAPALCSKFAIIMHASGNNIMLNEIEIMRHKSLSLLVAFLTPRSVFARDRVN